MSLCFTLFPVTSFQQNCTLLWDEQTRDAVLVDVGGAADKLWDELTQRQLALQAIWLTHGHVDHVAGVVAMLEQCRVPVYGPHHADDFWLQQLPVITRNYHFPISPVFTPDHWLQEGCTLLVGEHQFQVLHIPGHTPGHVVFYNQKDQLLIAGDVLFRESIGRTDFPMGSHQDLIHHIHTKILTLPDDTRVITGHGPMTSIGHEKKFNPFL